MAYDQEEDPDFEVQDISEESDESSDEEENKEEDRPFEPLMVWTSPFQGGEAKGLPSSM